MRFAALPVTSGRNPDKWNEIRARLEQVWDSDWYFEVRAYRNFAHRAFNNVQAVILKEATGDRAMHVDLFPVREGQRAHVPIQEQLTLYLEKMREIGLAVLPTGDARLAPNPQMEPTRR